MTQTRTPTATDRLAEQYFAAEITQSPLLATYLGLPEGQDRYDDLSPAGLAAGAELAERTLRAAAGLTPIDAVDEVTLAVLRERLGLRLETHAAGADLLSLNGIASGLHELQEI